MKIYVKLNSVSSLVGNIVSAAILLRASLIYNIIINVSFYYLKFCSAGLISQ